MNQQPYSTWLSLIVLVFAASGCGGAAADSAPGDNKNAAPKTSDQGSANVPQLARGTIGSGDIDRATVETLRSQVLADDQGQRANAVQRLGEIKDAESLPKLIDAMEDASPEVRQNAFDALVHITNLRVPFDSHSSPDERATAVTFYRAFWEEHKDPNGPFMQVLKNPSLKYTKYGQESEGQKQ